MIPLYRDGQSAPAPRNARSPMAPDLSGRLRVDTSGVARAAYDATAQEKLGPGAFQGDAIAGNAWANTMQHLGGILGQVANDRMEAKNYADLTDAQAFLSTKEAEFEKVKQENLSKPEEWGSLWEQHVESARNALDANESYSPVVKEQLRNHLVKWSSHGLINTEHDATQSIFKRATTSSEAKFLTFIENGNIAGAEEEKRLQVSKGWKTEEDAQLDLLRGKKQVALQNHKSFRDSLTVLTEVQPNEEEAMKLIDSQDLTDDEKAIYKDEAKGKIGKQIEIMQGRKQAANYGSVAMAIANNENVDPVVINQMVKSGDFDPVVGARVITSLREKQGVLEDAANPSYDYMPHLEMESLITDAQAYDPDDDPTQKRKADLYAKALALGMNQTQMARFTGVFGEAEKNNADATGKSASAEKTYGRNKIAYAINQTNAGYMTSVWNPELEKMLADQSSLERIGIAKAEAATIVKAAGSDKSEALNLLRKASPTLKDPALMEKSGFKSVEDATAMGRTYALLRRAASSDKDGMILNEESKMKGEFMSAKVFQQFEGWYQSQPEKPDQAKIDAWISDKTESKLQGKANKFYLMPQDKPKTVSDVSAGSSTERYAALADGALQGIASSYGYAGDADNGLNSIGMKRGTQPYFGTHPTVALAPEVAAKLGVRLPKKNDKGEWDISKSKLQVEGEDGKLVTVIYDENGMTIDPRSKNKLVDLTPEASAALGLSIGSNTSNIKLRKYKDS